MSTQRGADINELVGRRIRDIRQEHRIRQVDLADAAGLTRAVVLGIESGRRRVTVAEAAQLALALGVPFRSLLEGMPPADLDALGFGARQIAHVVRPILPLLSAETYEELRARFDAGGQGLPEETVAVLAWLFRFEPEQAARGGTEKAQPNEPSTA